MTEVPANNSSLNDTSVVASSSCEFYRDIYYDPSMALPSVAIFATIYCTIFVLGIIGNALVLLLTLTNRKLQTVQNLFILNLCGADLFVCLFSLPITPITNIDKNWYFGSATCHALPWIQGIAVFISTHSLCIIALDRYLLVMKPHYRLGREWAKYVMATIWSLSILFTLPYGMYMQLTEVPNVCGRFCTESWPDANPRKAYTVFVLVAQFVLPFAIMFCCYYVIFTRLNRRLSTKMRKMDECTLILTTTNTPRTLTATALSTACGENMESEQEFQDRRRITLLTRTRRNNVILAGMVCVFAIAWFPHNFVSMMMEFFDEEFFRREDGVEMIYLINLCTHSTAMLTNIANPILYAMLNPAFVEIFKKNFLNCKRKPALFV